MIFAETTSQAEARRVEGGKMTSGQRRIRNEVPTQKLRRLRHVGHASGRGLVLGQTYLSWTPCTGKAEILLCMQGN